MLSFEARVAEKRQLDPPPVPDSATKRRRQADIGDAVMSAGDFSAPTANALALSQPGDAGDIYIHRAAPEFAGVPAVLPGGRLGIVSLSDFAGQHLVVVFYASDFSSESAAAIAPYSEHIGAFQQIGCNVVVCSTDSEFAHFRWQQLPRSSGGIGSITVPMLADRTRQISRSFGVLCQRTGQALASVFIIDSSQTIRVAIVDENAVRYSAMDVLQIVGALRSSPQ